MFGTPCGGGGGCNIGCIALLIAALALDALVVFGIIALFGLWG